MDNTEKAAHLFDQYAHQYQEKYMDVAMYQAAFDLFCARLESKAQILEIACGPGNITQYLLQQRPDLQILGTDLAPTMLDLARRNNPGASFRLLDARDISRLQGPYAGLMCGFCLPYLSKGEAKKLIADAADLLAPAGVFFLSTMEGDDQQSGMTGPSSGGDEQIFMQYYEADFLLESCREQGFELLDLQRMQYSGPDGQPVTDLLLLLQKNI